MLCIVQGEDRPPPVWTRLNPACSATPMRTRQKSPLGALWVRLERQRTTPRAELLRHHGLGPELGCGLRPNFHSGLAKHPLEDHINALEVIIEIEHLAKFSPAQQLRDVRIAHEVGEEVAFLAV